MSHPTTLIRFVSIVIINILPFNYTINVSNIDKI